MPAPHWPPACRTLPYTVYYRHRTPAVHCRTPTDSCHSVHRLYIFILWYSSPGLRLAKPGHMQLTVALGHGITACSASLRPLRHRLRRWLADGSANHLRAHLLYTLRTPTQTCRTPAVHTEQTPTDSVPRRTLRTVYHGAHTPYTVPLRTPTATRLRTPTYTEPTPTASPWYTVVAPMAYTLRGQHRRTDNGQNGHNGQFRPI